MLDARGMATSVTRGFGNVIAESFFSALRMPTRIRAEGGGATGATGTVREYIWLAETQIAPTMGSRTVVDRPLAVVNAVNTASPVTWYIHADHLNRPVKMTDAAKAAVWTAVWAPWGSPHSITGTATLDARFPGQWYQMEAGLHYNWHRSYDPSLGRYTQPDPLGFVDGPSVYAYARSTPLRYVDRDGRYSSLPWVPPSTTVPTPGMPVPPSFPVPPGMVLPPDQDFDLEMPEPENFNEPRTEQEQKDYKEYKEFCARRPPSGTEKCEAIRQMIKLRSQCCSMRQAWDDRYFPGRHMQAIQECRASEANLIAKYERECKQACLGGQ